MRYPVGVEGFFYKERLEDKVESGTFFIFWMVWKVRNDVFRDDVWSIQKLKFSFVNLLWSETKLYIKDGPTTFWFNLLIEWLLIEEGSFLYLLLRLMLFFVGG